MKPAGKRFPLPLHISVPLLMLACSCCFLLLTGLGLYQRAQERESERRGSIALDQSERLAKALLRASQNGAPAFYDEITWLANDRWLHWAAVVNNDGLIVHSTDSHEVGLPLSQVVSSNVADGVKAASDTGLPQHRFEGVTAVAIRPVYQEGTSALRWVILVERDMTPALERERELTISDAWYAGTILLVFCFGLWWAMHRFLTRRVQQLLGQIRGGELAKKAPLTGSDEFAEISRAYWESENLLLQVIANLPDVFYMSSIGPRKLIYLSPAYQKVWGLDPETVLSDTVYKWLGLVHEDDRHTVMSIHDPIFAGAEETSAQYRIYGPNGTIRWLESKAFPVRDVNGKIYRIAGTTTNITERKELEQAILDTSERERRGIGHDLHDDLCQRLAAIKLRCEIIAHGLREGRAAEDAAVEKIGIQIGEAATLCRNIARGLSPVNLEGDGLVHALNGLVTISKTIYDVQCSFDCPEPVLMGNNDTATNLYRIAQELINNAARHAHPTKICVRLVKDVHSIRLEVKNDGAPFSEPVHGHEGMGLRIIRYRANALGGTVRYVKRTNGDPYNAAICLVPESVCNLL